MYNYHHTHYKINKISQLKESDVISQTYLNFRYYDFYLNLQYGNMVLYNIVGRTWIGSELSVPCDKKYAEGLGKWGV